MLFFYTSSLYSMDLLNLSDSLNAYQWNRRNWEMGNQRIDKSPWFEWWYYKVILPHSHDAFYFVYGVVNPWDKHHARPTTRSYVLMGDFKNKYNVEEVFGLDDFSASYETPYVKVHQSSAFAHAIVGEIIDKDHHRTWWNIKISKKWSYPSLGLVTGSGITAIEWYPAQADALCTGEIYSQGILHNFSEVPCYQDKNWGTQFPKWWTWIVSNYFDHHAETALVVGGGRPYITKGPSPVEGVVVGFKHQGKEYSFRPIDLNYIRQDIKFGKWEIEAINLTHKIVISASAPKESFMDLIFLTPDGKLFHDYEALLGKVDVHLYERSFYNRKMWKKIGSFHSNFAGIEYGSYDTH